MKGTRVQAIIRELRGEKIDIVEWSEDPAVFVTNAISPARAQRVTIADPLEKVVEVIVEDRQLSLAIGKKGQNVRLAAKLTGWKIDIKSEEEKRREVEAEFDGLAAPGPATLTLPGLDEEQVLRLTDAGLDSADRLLTATTDQLVAVAGIDPEVADELKAAVREQVAAPATEAADESAPATEAADESAPATEAADESAPATEAADEQTTS
jgi:N utilization substance protein A